LEGLGQEQRVHVQHDKTERRFHVQTSEGSGELTYTQVGDTIDLQHTFVEEPARDAGVADALVRAAMNYARGEGLRVVPSCPYVRSWLKRHPDQAAAGPA
jgi:predicted GNAT family acetyltransferase